MTQPTPKGASPNWWCRFPMAKLSHLSQLSHSPPRRPALGFTLVELLIAITILSFIAVIGWRGLDSILRSRAVLTTDMAQLRGLQLAFSQLQSDCQHIVATGGLNSRTTLSIDPQRLTMVRAVFVDNQPSRYQVVAYRVKDGVLTRRESPATRDLIELDSLWDAILSDKDSIVPVTLQSGVTGMAIQVWYSDSPGWRTQTSNGLKPVNAPGAPAAIATGLEVALQIQGHSASIVKDFLLGAV